MPPHQSNQGPLIPYFNMSFGYETQKRSSNTPSFWGEMVEPWFNWEIHGKSMLNAIFWGVMLGDCHFFTPSFPQGFPPVEVSQRHRAHGQRGGARQQPSARVTAAWGNDGSWSLGIEVIGGRPDFRAKFGTYMAMLFEFMARLFGIYGVLLGTMVDKLYDKLM